MNGGGQALSFESMGSTVHWHGTSETSVPLSSYKHTWLRLRKNLWDLSSGPPFLPLEQVQGERRAASQVCSTQTIGECSLSHRSNLLPVGRPSWYLCTIPRDWCQQPISASAKQMKALFPRMPGWNGFFLKSPFAITPCFSTAMELERQVKR